MSHVPEDDARTYDEPLQSVIGEVQRRFGPQAIRKLRHNDAALQRPGIPTDFPTLDKLLGSGGIPAGALTELVGRPTSGAATLALRIAAQAQSRQHVVVYFDPQGTFDPDYAARCGVQVERLLLANTASRPQALHIAADLIASNSVGLVLLDGVLSPSPQGVLVSQISSALRRLKAVLRGMPCVALSLVSSPTNDDLLAVNAAATLSSFASLRLLVERERWLEDGRDVCGYQARVTVLRNQFAPAGRSTSIAITFDDLPDGDAT